MESKVLPCPECGSLDVSNVLISTRPFCNSCGYHAPMDWGTKEESQEEWNRISAARWELKEIPNRVENLEKRVSELEKDKEKDDSEPQK